MKTSHKLTTIVAALVLSVSAIAHSDNTESTSKATSNKQSSYFFILDPRTWSNLDSNSSEQLCPLFLD